MTRRLAQQALVALGLIISSVFAYLALRGIKFSATWNAIRESNYWWLFPVSAALAVSVVLRSIRWGVLFAPGRQPSLGALTKANLLGLFVNNILPARAGEAARVLAIRSYSGVSAAEAAATIVVERLFDVLSLLALLFVCTPWLPHVAWLRAAALVAVVALVIVALLAGIAAHVARNRVPSGLLALTRIPLVSPSLVSAAENFGQGLSALRRPRAAIVAAAWTIAGWVAFGVACWWLMTGFGIHVSPLAGLLVVVGIGMAFLVPAAPAAIGVFEAAGLAALNAYGVSSSRALGYVLVLHALNFFPFLIAGVVILALDYGRDWQTAFASQHAAAASAGFTRNDREDVEQVER